MGERVRVRVEPELTRNAAIAIAAVVGVLLVASAAVAVAFDQPRVEGAESEFGTVEQNESTIDTRIVLRNPNDVAVPRASISWSRHHWTDSISVAGGDASSSLASRYATGVNCSPG